MKPLSQNADEARFDFYLSGMASALHALISHYSRTGSVPDLFNERINALSHDAFASCNLQWIARDDNTPLPNVTALHQFLVQVASALALDLRQITVAYVLMEQVLFKKKELRTLVQPFAIRPFFIGCCIIAIKLTEDSTTLMSELAEGLNVYFPEVKSDTLHSYERSILCELDWAVPIDPAHYQTYYGHLVNESQRAKQENAVSMPARIV